MNGFFNVVLKNKDLRSTTFCRGCKNCGRVGRFGSASTFAATQVPTRAAEENLFANPGCALGPDYRQIGSEHVLIGPAGASPSKAQRGDAILAVDCQLIARLQSRAAGPSSAAPVSQSRR